MGTNKETDELDYVQNSLLFQTTPINRQSFRIQQVQIFYTAVYATVDVSRYIMLTFLVN